MEERYEPSSDFLKSVIDEEIPLSGSLFADQNLRRLIALTRDSDRSNRDWACMLLSQEDVDTLEVRNALLVAAEDEDPYVRGEAIVGLAQRSPKLAIPFVLAALSEEQCAMQIFQAAWEISDPSLIDALKPWAKPSEVEQVDCWARKALESCSNALDL